jgi:NAD(P)-dependent dehydrogenase (short-subunit alcohol dehydrogenase family)
MLGCTLAAQDMIERDASGVILNTSSVNSEFISPNHIEYDATKGAVKMITRTAAYQLAEHGVQVNAVAPGLIPTHLSESGPEAAKAALEQTNSRRRSHWIAPVSRRKSPAVRCSSVRTPRRTSPGNSSTSTGAIRSSN